MMDMRHCRGMHYLGEPAYNMLDSFPETARNIMIKDVNCKTDEKPLQILVCRQVTVVPTFMHVVLN